MSLTGDLSRAEAEQLAGIEAADQAEGELWPD